MPELNLLQKTIGKTRDTISCTQPNALEKFSFSIEQFLNSQLRRETKANRDLKVQQDGPNKILEPNEKRAKSLKVILSTVGVAMGVFVAIAPWIYSPSVLVGHQAVSNIPEYIPAMFYKLLFGYAGGGLALFSFANIFEKKATTSSDVEK